MLLSDRSVPSLSIIIPIYNASEWLAQLGETLRGQGLDCPAEVIFVDDGSTDGSIELLKSFEIPDVEVRVLSQKNAGQGAARNLGLRQARMKYVYMMDQDDLLVPGTLREHLRILEDEEADVVRFKFDTPTPGGCTEAQPYRRPNIIGRMTGEEYVCRTKGLHDGTPVWTAIFLREYALRVGAEFDPRVRYFEDMVFTWRLMLPARKVVMTDAVGYHWVQRPQSDLHTADRDHKIARRLTLPHLVRAFRSLVPQARTPEARYWVEQKAVWYVFAFWSMVLSLRAIPAKEAVKTLDEHIREGLYPKNPRYPDHPDLYPASAVTKLRWRLIFNRNLLKFASKILLP